MLLVINLQIRNRFVRTAGQRCKDNGFVLNASRFDIKIYSYKYKTAFILFKNTNGISPFWMKGRVHQKSVKAFYIRYLMASYISKKIIFVQINKRGTTLK